MSCVVGGPRPSSCAAENPGWQDDWAYGCRDWGAADCFQALSCDTKTPAMGDYRTICCHAAWRCLMNDCIMADAANEKNVSFSFFNEIQRRCKKMRIGSGIKAGSTTVPTVNGLKFVSDPQFQHLV